MSKSDPETMIDPLDMISKYGADALRLSMIVGQSPGADSRLYEEKIAGYRNFINKLWNASRFVLMKCEEGKMSPQDLTKLPHASDLSLADRALLHALEVLVEDVTKGLTEYRLSEVGERIYAFVWDYFCDWYLELSKGSANLAVLVHTLRKILILLHPYCPFVTEELWESVKAKDASMLITQEWPNAKAERKDPDAFAQFQTLIDVVTAIRRLRSESGIEPGKEIEVTIVSTKHRKLLEAEEEHIRGLAKIKDIVFQTKVAKSKNSVAAILTDIEVHVSLEGLIDKEKELKKLQKEMDDLARRITGSAAKLSNDEFRKNAPEEIQSNLRKQHALAQEQYMALEKRYKALS
jgi:valyl-tRNA synthetase